MNVEAASRVLNAPICTVKFCDGCASTQRVPASPDAGFGTGCGALGRAPGFFSAALAGAFGPAEAVSSPPRHLATFSEKC